VTCGLVSGGGLERGPLRCFTDYDWFYFLTVQARALRNLVLTVSSTYPEAPQTHSVFGQMAPHGVGIEQFASQKS
jgi:hypothetical protein